MNWFFYNFNSYFITKVLLQHFYLILVNCNIDSLDLRVLRKLDFLEHFLSKEFQTKVIDLEPISSLFYTNLTNLNSYKKKKVAYKKTVIQ